MATKIEDQGIRRLRGESFTIAGSAGDRALLGKRSRYSEVLIEPAAAIRLMLSPLVDALYFYDVSALSYIDLKAVSPALIDPDSGSGATGATFDGWATGDFLYVGCDRPFGGILVTLNASDNTTASVLSCKYSKSDATFATQAITDGTIDTGATLGQASASKLITLDAIPTDWGKFSLAQMGITGAPGGERYWLRFQVSAGLDADVEATRILALAAATGVGPTSTDGAYLKASVEYTIDLSDYVGALEAIAQGAGATTANVTWVERG